MLATLFDIRAAICLYLDKTYEEVSWGTDVVVDVDAEEIIAWNIEDPVEPTIQHLKDIWYPYYYKTVGLSRIKEQFESWIETGGVGCQTTVPDGEGGFIKVDCKKTPYKDDLQNFEKLKFFLEQTGQTQTYIKDYFNQMRLVNLTELATIVLQLTGYGLGLYQVKWTKEATIEAMEIEEGESIQEFVARLETVNFPE